MGYLWPIPATLHYEPFFDFASLLDPVYLNLDMLLEKCTSPESIISHLSIMMLHFYTNLLLKRRVGLQNQIFHFEVK